MKIECLGSSSKGNCYIVELESGDVIILDAGVPYSLIKKALGYRRTKVLGVLLTHEHGDHSRAVKAMLDDGLKIYTSEGTAKALGIEDKPRVLKAVAGRKIVLKENVHAMALNAVHPAEEPFLFTLSDRSTKENLVFLTDTAYVEYAFNGFSYYLIECNYVSSIAKDKRKHGTYSMSEGHMSLTSTLQLLESSDLSKARQIILLHLSDSNSDSNLMIQEVYEATGVATDVADEGKLWVFEPFPF